MKMAISTRDALPRSELRITVAHGKRKTASTAKTTYKNAYKK